MLTGDLKVVDGDSIAGAEGPKQGRNGAEFEIVFLEQFRLSRRGGGWTRGWAEVVRQRKRRPIGNGGAGWKGGKGGPVD